MNAESSARTVLSLYRRLIRYGQQLQLTDKPYYQRRVRSEFRRNRDLTDPVAIDFSIKVILATIHVAHHKLLNDTQSLSTIFYRKAKPFFPIDACCRLKSNSHPVRTMFLLRVASAQICHQPIQQIATITAIRTFVSKSISHIDRSLVPKLDENELEEQFVRGSGPGGQVVNKTSNAVVLRHLPTNLLVKCHSSRSLDQNRKEARRLLTMRLDNHLNGERSVEQQMLRLGKSKSAENVRRRRKTDEMKRLWREREEEAMKQDPKD